jgi:PAS domain S-box-containing protein
MYQDLGPRINSDASRTPLQRFWERLTAPSPKLTKVDERHKARLLASMLVVLILLGFGLSALPSALGQTDGLFKDPIFYVGLGACSMLGVAYGFSRTSRFQIGTVIALLVCSGAIIGAALVDPDASPGLMAFMLIPIVLASMLLPIRIVTAIIALTMILIAVSPFVAGNTSFEDVLIGEFSLTLIISIMLLMLLEYRNRVEEQRRTLLAASEERYRKLVEASPDMIAVKRQGTFLFINSAGVRLLGGFKPEEIIERSVWEFISTEDRPRLEEAMPIRDEVITLEHTLSRLDGQLRDVESTMIITDYFGEPAMQIVTRDITARKHAETEMRRLRLGIEQSGEAIFMTDPGGKILYVNPAFERIYGYSRDEAIGQTPRLLKSGTLSQEAYEAMWKMLLSKQVVFSHMTNRRKDGRNIEVESTSSPVLDEDENIIGFLAIQRDITDRRLADEALQYYAARLELLHNIDHIILTSSDAAEMGDRVLEQLEKFIPYKRAGVLLFDFKSGMAEFLSSAGADVELFKPGSRVPLRSFQNIDALRLGDHVLVHDIKVLDFDDETYRSLAAAGIGAYVVMPLLAHGVLLGSINLGVSDASEITSGAVAILHEIGDQVAIAIEDTQLREAMELHSERLEAEVVARTQELRRIKDRAEAILDSAPDSMLLIRADGCIETGNDAFQAMFGYQPDEMYGVPLIHMISGESRAILENALKHTLDYGQPVRREVAALRKDGSAFDADVALAPIQGEEQIAGVVCSLRDISALKEVERMKDNFVSNVSHELRTPITSLKLYHQLLVMNPDKYQDYVSSLQREMHRLERIVEDLLLLSRLDQRRVSMSMGAIDLNALIADFIQDREPMAHEHQLTLGFTPAPDLPAVLGEGNMIGQVLSILFTNAVSYTPAGGTVQISTHSDANNNRVVGFSVCDTGPGVPVEERDQLFKRFFRGSASHAVNAPGTGLGLSIAHEIIELHNGRIQVNAPDMLCEGEYAGAVFTVWLPIANSG